VIITEVVRMQAKMPAIMQGRINSFQTLGTHDGPGIRFVAFMQGCQLRCIYCHNPETWCLEKGKQYCAQEVFQKIIKYKPYFGKDGGVTISGGEPLLQAIFLRELLKLCKSNNIQTAIDTSGSIINDDVENLLEFVDLVLLDIKFTSDKSYKKYTGCGIEKVLDFLSFTEKLNKQVWIRHVIVPNITDSIDNIINLKKLISPFKCVKKIELLPFKKLCIEKYEQLGLPFKLIDTPETTQEKIEELKALL
jgi:pyruvate formate lyase activating enzyme